jgi:hypothetical protein
MAEALPRVWDKGSLLVVVRLALGLRAASEPVGRYRMLAPGQGRGQLPLQLVRSRAARGQPLVVLVPGQPLAALVLVPG